MLEFIGYVIIGVTAGYVTVDAYGPFTLRWFLVTFLTCLGVFLIKTGQQT